MANKFYAPADARAAGVQDLFATVAPRYDLINDLQSFGLHRRWKRQLIQWADPKPGERALDLCCGTGDVSFALAAKGADTTGLDFSEPMLEIARKRAQHETTPAGPALPGGRASPRAPIIFVQGDAQNLSYSDDSFDIVTISYGLRNLIDWRAGLLEMRRVAKPGARLLVLDFG